jgi:hypothetical protein
VCRPARDLRESIPPAPGRAFRVAAPATATLPATANPSGSRSEDLSRVAAAARPNLPPRNFPPQHADPKCTYRLDTPYFRPSCRRVEAASGASPARRSGKWTRTAPARQVRAEDAGRPCQGAGRQRTRFAALRRPRGGPGPRPECGRRLLELLGTTRVLTLALDQPLRLVPVAVQRHHPARTGLLSDQRRAARATWNTLGPWRIISSRVARVLARLSGPKGMTCRHTSTSAPSAVTLWRSVRASPTTPSPCARPARARCARCSTLWAWSSRAPASTARTAAPARPARCRRNPRPARPTAPRPMVPRVAPPRVARLRATDPRLVLRRVLRRRVAGRRPRARAALPDPPPAGSGHPVLWMTGGPR